MKLLVFGGGGQLGYELLTRARDLRFEVAAPVFSEVDICDQHGVQRFVKSIRPEAIINAAAYTAVDKAEQEQELAYAVNARGAHHVALAAAEIGARLLHVSTDYVFAGDGDKPLVESDPTEPTSVYGKTKLEGERLVLSSCPSALVVRTASLHGQRGENFVHTMLKLFAERDMVKVVDDQRMSPTWAGWLAEALLDLSRGGASGSFPVGVVHATSGGDVSWFEFASAIYEEAAPVSNAGGGEHPGQSDERAGRQPDGPRWKAQLARTSMRELNRPAPRPKYSVCSAALITQLLGRAPLGWREGLRSHLADIQRLAN